MLLVGGSEDGSVSAAPFRSNLYSVVCQTQVSVWNVSIGGALAVSNIGLELLAIREPLGEGILSSLIVYDNV